MSRIIERQESRTLAHREEAPMEGMGDVSHPNEGVGSDELAHTIGKVTIESFDIEDSNVESFIEALKSNLKLIPSATKASLET